MYFYTVPVGGIVVTNFTMKFLLSETIFLLLPNSDHKTNIFMSFSIHKVTMNKIVLWINICAGDYTVKRAIIANNAYENQIFL